MMKMKAARNYHVYRRPGVWHLFEGGSYIGRVDPARREVRLSEGFADQKAEVRVFLGRVCGMMPEVLVDGGGPVVPDEPVPGFPPEVEALAEWDKGDLTPRVLEWARSHWDEAVFRRRYEGRAAYIATDAGPVDGPAGGADDAGEGGFSVRDFAEREGLGDAAARRRVREGLEAGTIRMVLKGSGRQPTLYKHSTTKES